MGFFDWVAPIISDVASGDAPFTGMLSDVGAPDSVQNLNTFASDLNTWKGRQNTRSMKDWLKGDQGGWETLDQMVDLPRYGQYSDQKNNGPTGNQGLVDYGFRKLGDQQPQWFKDMMSSVGTGVGGYLYGPGGAAVMAGLSSKAQQGSDNRDYHTGFRNAGVAAASTWAAGELSGSNASDASKAGDVAYKEALANTGDEAAAQAARDEAVQMYAASEASGQVAKKGMGELTSEALQSAVPDYVKGALWQRLLQGLMPEMKTAQLQNKIFTNPEYAYTPEQPKVAPEGPITTPGLMQQSNMQTSGLPELSGPAPVPYTQDYSQAGRDYKKKLQEEQDKYLADIEEKLMNQYQYLA